jgi:uncharacterized membrane protein YphA (DoxX/SURF4 family)
MRRDQSKRDRLLSAFVVIVRLGLGFALLWSSLPKIRQPYTFLGNVYEYELIGAKLGMLVAMTLPWLELLLGLCLISGLFVSGALLGAVVLMGVFSLAQASALWRGLAITCGCFNPFGTEPIGYTTLIRTSLLAVAATLGYALVLFRTRGMPQCTALPEDHPR